MNSLYKVLFFLQKEMIEPVAFGWFHWMCIGIMLITICFLYKKKDTHSEKQLKIVLGVYGGVVLILEMLKQISWTVTYNIVISEFLWNYEWYAFPFQLCTTPMFVSLICVFLKKGKLRDCLLSYIAYTTIIGSIATIIMPDSCLVNDILVNVHTMWLHLGSFVVSVYLLMSGEVKIDFKAWKKSIPVFLSFTTIANFLNVIVYQADVLNGETFNMFYISPYFISSLPVFGELQQNVPYIVFLMTYVLALIFGSYLIFQIAKFMNGKHKRIVV